MLNARVPHHHPKTHLLKPDFQGGGIRRQGFGLDFPDEPVVTNPSSNAEDVGSIPGQGTKLPYAVGQLSP